MTPRISGQLIAGPHGDKQRPTTIHTHTVCRSPHLPGGSHREPPQTCNLHTEMPQARNQTHYLLAVGLQCKPLRRCVFCRHFLCDNQILSKVHSCMASVCPYLPFPRWPAGGERVWRRRRRRPPGRVDGAVQRLGVEAPGGRALPAPGHRSAAVGDRGAVRAAHPRPDGGARHVGAQPAQPVEDHGGRFPEAQREPGGRPSLRPHAHRVLTGDRSALCFCHFQSFCPSAGGHFPNDTCTSSLSLRPATSHPSYPSLPLTFFNLFGESAAAKFVPSPGTAACCRLLPFQC